MERVSRELVFLLTRSLIGGPLLIAYLFCDLKLRFNDVTCGSGKIGLFGFKKIIHGGRKKYAHLKI